MAICSRHSSLPFLIEMRSTLDFESITDYTTATVLHHDFFAFFSLENKNLRHRFCQYYYYNMKNSPNDSEEKASNA